MVEAIRVQGGTAMSHRPRAGIARAATEPIAPIGTAYLLLLTDGQTWGDEDACRAHRRSSWRRWACNITALGLGDEWNEKLLDDLAAATGGTSDYIADPQDIGQYFQRAAQLRARQQCATGAC